MKCWSLTSAAAACLMFLAATSCQSSNQDSSSARGNHNMIQKSQFGTTRDGTPVELYTLTNRNGMVARVMNYGAILTELHVPDRSGKTADVVLGFSDFNDYLQHNPFFGATAGRYANRIANGQFELDGKTYHLFVNNGPNTLHGGKVGFDKRVWKARQTPDLKGVVFSYLSPDGEENFPGNLNVTCTYTLDDDNSLKIEFTATTDKPTIVNLANHSYFNLGGESSGTVLDEILTINADRYTVVNDQLIPTGELRPVSGTPFDFTTPHVIGERIDQVPPGYDHNYVINSGGGKLALAARVKDPGSGRVMEVFTTQPGVQFYTGNFLDGKVVGIGGKPYPKHAGLCLETQHFPDSPHHPEFPSTVLRPGEKYDQATVFKFSVE